MGRHKLKLLVATVALVCISSGCQPEDAALMAAFKYARNAGEQVPIVLIHGMLGAHLSDSTTGEARWPGGLWRLMFHDFADLALPIDEKTLLPKDDGLRPTHLFDEAAGEDFYGILVDTLTGPGGYKLRGQGVKRPTLYIFLYDWRQDIVTNATRLGQYIRNIRAEHGDSKMRVDVVAHSMGGLLVRYFVRYGEEDVLGQENPPDPTLAGQDFVRRAVLVATPNFGSISGLQSAIMGHKVGMRDIPPEVGATWPSVTQLMPNPARAWMVNEKGEELARDLYSTATWREFEWGIFDPDVRRKATATFDEEEDGEKRLALLESAFEQNLVRARRFHDVMSRPVSKCASKYIVFAGDCVPTPASCLMELVDGEKLLRLHPDDIDNRLEGVDYEALMLEPGDGRVTRSSAIARTQLGFRGFSTGKETFPLAYSVFLCSQHDKLPSNPTFRNNLLYILLSK